MQKGISICLTGANVHETARTLGARLIELGCCTEQMDSEAVERLGGEETAGYVCALLSRNKVIAIVTAPGVKAQGDAVDVEIDPNDTPDFAAEKIVDMLAQRQCITLDTGGYSPEEEEQIRRRLADLGYIE